METARHRPPALHVSTDKYNVTNAPVLDSVVSAGTLSPDVQPNNPLLFPLQCPAPNGLPSVSKIGNYLLTERRPDMSPGIAVYKAVHIVTQQNFLCRVLAMDRCQTSLMPFTAAGFHPYINGITEVLVGSTCVYAMHRSDVDVVEDLHTYVRRRRRLAEPEAAQLFAQALEAVAHCHRNGIIVRDIKLRRFVFANAERTCLQLDSLYDAVMFSANDDSLSDKHGCLAYVSPEMLDATFIGTSSSSGSVYESVAGATSLASTASKGQYAGRPADMWSLGVMLYTMLVGRYPFADTDACALFARIRRGRYPLPADINLSASARCLIRSLLSVNPTDRLTAEEALSHPWFTAVTESESVSSVSLAPFRRIEEHTVPELPETSSDEFLIE